MAKKTETKAETKTRAKKISLRSHLESDTKLDKDGEVVYAEADQGSVTALNLWLHGEDLDPGLIEVVVVNETTGGQYRRETAVENGGFSFQLLNLAPGDHEAVVYHSTSGEIGRTTFTLT